MGRDQNSPDNQLELRALHYINSVMEERQKEKQKEQRLVKGAQRPLNNWHNQSIITVITAVLSLLQLQNGPEVFEAPCLCVQCISVDYIKSRL